MPFSSSFYDKLRPMLESRSVDWTLVTMKDVQYAVAALIGERQKLRDKERRKVPLSPEEIAFMRESGIQIPLLFEGQAIKWAERGRAALFEKVQIANIVMPTEEERAERRRIHDRLDAIARRLADTQVPKEA
jgi:hypothetical protein